MSESDQHPAQRPPAYADALTQALSDLRQDMRAGIHELSKRLGKIEETLSLASTEQAVSRVKLEELVVQQVSLEARVMQLENAERDRSTREKESEKAKQPKQYGVATTAVIGVLVSVLVAPILCWLLLSIAKFVVQNQPPTAVQPP